MIFYIIFKLFYTIIDVSIMPKCFPYCTYSSCSDHGGHLTPYQVQWQSTRDTEKWMFLLPLLCLTGLSWESNNYRGWGWGRNKLFLLVTVSLDVSWNNTVCSILCKTPSAVKCNAETELWGEKMSLCILTKGIHMKCSVWHPPRHYQWAFDGGRGETGRLWQYHFWSFCQMRQLRHQHLWLFRS